MIKAFATNLINNHNSNASFVDWYNNKTLDGNYGAAIENIKGGQVKGTVTGGQTVIGNGSDLVIDFTAVFLYNYKVVFYTPFYFFFRPSPSKFFIFPKMDSKLGSSKPNPTNKNVLETKSPRKAVTNREFFSLYLS